MAQIEIKGVIGQDYTYKQFITDYASAKGEPITLYIDSVGGYVDEGEAIADFIQSHSDKFTRVINSGDVASIAANIFLALPFEKRFFNMSKGVALIHNPFIDDMSGFSGTADKLQMLTDEMKAVESKVAKFITKQTNADPDVVTALMGINEPLTEQQLVSINFANIIKFQAVAYLKKEEMKKEEIEQIVDEKNKTFLEKLMAIFKPKFVAIMLTTGEGTQIEFPEVQDGETPAVGNVAKNADGSIPNGEVVMATGEIYVFENGKLTEIKPKEETEVEVEVKANPEMEALKAELEAAHKELAELKAQATELSEVKAQLAKIKSEMVTEKPAEKTEKEENEVSDLIKAAKSMKQQIKK